MKSNGIIWLSVFAFVTGLFMGLFFCKKMQKPVYLPQIHTNTIILEKKIKEKQNENSVLEDSKTNLEKDIYRLIKQYED